MRIKQVLGIIILFLLYPCLSYAAEVKFAAKPEVQAFIKEMEHKYHFKKRYLIFLLNSVKERPAIIQSAKAPLEQKPWYIYRMLFVTDWRIREGLLFWDKYKNALAKAEKIYGVPASVIVATIGVETKYGQNNGKHRVIDALANLAFNHSPRSPYFQKELEEFLLLAREQHINPLKIMGSYAGAIGQPQFMPSSYRRYAINFSHSGRISLSDNQIDVIGSIANYYKQHGWIANQPIVLPLTLKNNTDFSLRKLEHLQKFSQLDLAKYGVKLNQKLHFDKEISFLQLEGRFGNEYWIIFPNFNVIKRYNFSNHYAMAIYQLSNYIAKLKKKLNDV